MIQARDIILCLGQRIKRCNSGLLVGVISILNSDEVGTSRCDEVPPYGQYLHISAYDHVDDILDIVS